MNKFWLTGNLTHDLELQRTKDNVPYCKFTVANNDGKRHPDDKGNFFRCEVWAEGAEAMVEKFSFRKGSPIMITGWMRHDEWEDKEGNRRQQVVLRVERFEPMERRRPEDGPAQEAPQRDATPSYGRNAKPARRRSDDDVVQSIAGRHEDDESLPF